MVRFVYNRLTFNHTFRLLSKQSDAKIVRQYSTKFICMDLLLRYRYICDLIKVLWEYDMAFVVNFILFSAAKEFYNWLKFDKVKVNFLTSIT